MNSYFMTDYQSNEFGAVLERLKKDNPTLPKDVFNEKAYQCLIQNYFLGRDLSGETWYALAEEDAKLAPDSPIGSIQLRVEYNKRPVGCEPLEKLDPVRIHDWVVMALSQPFSFEHYPRNAYIECIRITGRVAPDVDIEHTYWPSMHHYGEHTTAILQGTRCDQDLGVVWLDNMYTYEIDEKVLQRLLVGSSFAPDLAFGPAVYETFDQMSQDQRDAVLKDYKPILDAFVISDDKQTAVCERGGYKVYVEIINEHQINHLKD